MSVLEGMSNSELIDFAGELTVKIEKDRNNLSVWIALCAVFQRLHAVKLDQHIQSLMRIAELEAQLRGDSATMH